MSLVDPDARRAYTKGYREANRDAIRAYKHTPEQKERYRAAASVKRAGRTDAQVERERLAKATRRAARSPEQVERDRRHNKTWRANRPDEQVERDRSARSRWELEHRYNLTPKQHADMLAAQRGLCAYEGCGRRAARVDHSHTTGEVRGILCAGHNTGLGLLGDDVAGLLAGIAYLQRSLSVVA